MGQKPAHCLEIFLCSVIALTFSMARAIAASAPLSFEDCASEVERANPEIRAAQEKLQSSRYQARAAHSGFFPQLSGALNYSYGTSSTGSLITGVSRDADSTYSASLSARQSLFSGFQDRARVLQADANADVAATNLDIVRARVIFDLKSTFVGLRYAQDNVQLTNDIVKRRRENLKLVELRFDSGRENKGSLLLSKAYLNDARLEALRAGNAVSVVQQQLAQVLGRDDSDELTVAGEVPARVPDEAPRFREVSLATPEVRQATAQQRVADAGITLARSGFFPALDFTGTSGRTGNEWFPQNSRWSVGVGLTFPFFSGGKDYYETKAAVRTEKAAALNEEVVRRQVISKLKQAWNSYVEAFEKLKVDQSFLDAATARDEIGKAKYNNGLLSFEDWDIIENDLINRQKIYLQSRRDRFVAEAAWEQAKGAIVP